MGSWPLVQWVQNLDSFELTLFSVGSVGFFLAMGSAAHEIYGRKSMGQYRNAFCAALGGYLGLCVHDCWFRAFLPYEPALAVFLIAGGIAGALQIATIASSW